MGLAKEPEHDDDGEKVESGSYADVWLFDDVRTEYAALRTRNDRTSIQEARTLERYFGRFVSEKDPRFGDKMFKSLGRHPDGQGNDALVYEFKAYQFRIYGVVRTYRGKKCFLGTACDPEKKKDKADSRLLRKAAAVAARIKE